MIFKNADGDRVTVPFHSRKPLHPKIIKSILLDTNTSVEDFIELI